MLRKDALEIWQAGVNAVMPQAVVAQKIRLTQDVLHIDSCEVDLRNKSRIVVVGAGKASAAMARSLIDVFRNSNCRVPQVVGWVNCPEGTAQPQDSTDYLDADPKHLFLDKSAQQRGDSIVLHEARPAGINAPTQAAVDGTRQILKLVRDAQPDDVVICLISGGGSALLVSPPEGVSLQDKQNVAKVLSAAGADIEQLNLLRRCLSDVKGGGLARNCNARRLVAVLISDVLGDPIETIASGPCVETAYADPAHAVEMLLQLGLADEPQLFNVMNYLKNQSRLGQTGASTAANQVDVSHVILANNADAVDAAGVRAVKLGYQYIMQAATGPEGDVESVADRVSRSVQQLMREPGFDCWISGGEPTVVLPKNPGNGGRNQHLALSVLGRLSRMGWPDELSGRCPDLVFVSGGSDGEDGPTDAAGAYFDADVYRNAESKGLDLDEFLREANAYDYFKQAGGLLITGPTGTNVCDLRVGLVRRE